jgi:transglutaminase-like putative cysteine protease
MRSLRILLAGFAALLPATIARGDAEKVAPKSRDFRFTYAGTITGLKPGQKARVWLPVAPSNDDQTVELTTKETPAEPKIGREAIYGNQILYFEAPADANGEISFRLKYRVVRKEVRGESKAMAEDMALMARLLKPDARVPIDGKPLELIKDHKLPDDPMQKARHLYDVVNGYMRYSKEGIGWGNGDSVWACDSKYGNCSDFHSLFISLARSQKIPAVFEIGFPLPAKRGGGDIAGYHCWAKFHTAKGWVPVDISEANKNPELREYYFGNLTEDRIALSSGRDLELVPKQAGPSVNFLVNPYVEVDSKPLPKEQIKPKISFMDEK